MTAPALKVKAELSRVAVVTERRRPRESRAPKRWAVMTVSPLVKPMLTSTSMKNSGAETPTAASALMPIRRPTIMMSDML